MNRNKIATKKDGKAGKNLPNKTAALPAGFFFFPFSTIVLPALTGNSRNFQERQLKRRVKTGIP